MLAPAGTAGMEVHVTRMMVRGIGITLTLHQTVHWRGRAGIARTMGHWMSGT